MSEATIKYNGTTIASVDGGDSVTLATQGKYMSGNVTVEAAEGGGSAATVTVQCNGVDEYYLPDNATRNGDSVLLPVDSAFVVVGGNFMTEMVTTTGTVTKDFIGYLDRGIQAFLVHPGAQGGSITYETEA